MSMMDLQADISYNDAHGRGIAVADVLQKLKEDLAAQQAVLADAKRAVQHLQVAISAIERNEVETREQIEHQRPTNKRGYLTEAVIEALRDGIGTVSLIVRHLERQGIKTTAASVSNTIGRLQAKRKVRMDLNRNIWTLTAVSSQPQIDSASSIQG